MRTPENPSLTMNLNNTEEDVIAKMADVSRVRITSQYDALTADIYDFVEEHPIDDIRENAALGGGSFCLLQFCPLQANPKMSKQKL